VTRIGINGFGRIGRLALRAGWDRGDLQFVHVNEPNGGPDAAAHLLTFDSVHGRWERGARGDGATLTIDGVELVFSEAMAPGRGRLDGGRRRGGARVLRQVPNRRGVGGAYFERGVQKVIAAPVKNPGALNVVVGVNDDRYDPAVHDIVTAAPCTTNCLAPVVQVLHEGLGSCGDRSPRCMI